MQAKKRTRLKILQPPPQDETATVSKQKMKQRSDLFWDGSRMIQTLSKARLTLPPHCNHQKERRAEHHERCLTCQAPMGDGDKI